MLIILCDLVQLLPLSEGDMTICSPEKGNIALSEARGQYNLSRVNKSSCRPHSAEASSQYPARKGISFHPLHKRFDSFMLETIKWANF